MSLFTICLLAALCVGPSQSEYERGRTYALQRLADGVAPERLVVSGPLDFNDFDRGVLDAVREMQR